jgi:hypothetical protein
MTGNVLKMKKPEFNYELQYTVFLAAGDDFEVA